MLIEHAFCAGASQRVREEEDAGSQLRYQVPEGAAGRRLLQEASQGDLCPIVQSRCMLVVSYEHICLFVPRQADQRAERTARSMCQLLTAVASQMCGKLGWVYFSIPFSSFFIIRFFFCFCFFFISCFYFIFFSNCFFFFFIIVSVAGCSGGEDSGLPPLEAPVIIAEKHELIFFCFLARWRSTSARTS